MARYPKGSTPKLTDDLIEELCSVIRKGLYMESAAAICGISKDTLYRWLRKGKCDTKNSPEKTLSDAVLKAIAVAELKDLEVIEKAAQGSPDKFALDENGNIVLNSFGKPVIEEYGLPPNWKASAWRLERKYPERWGRQSRVEVESSSDNSIEVVFVDKLE